MYEKEVYWLQKTDRILADSGKLQVTNRAIGSNIPGSCLADKRIIRLDMDLINKKSTDFPDFVKKIKGGFSGSLSANFGASDNMACELVPLKPKELMAAKRVVSFLSHCIAVLAILIFSGSISM